jgi:hypothetical protein
MEPKNYQLDGLSLDFSKSSIEVFPAVSALANSTGLYLKFSKNKIKFIDVLNHAELLLDFDLCLIDAEIDETIVQLFAIFILIKNNNEPITDVKCISDATHFGRSLIINEIKKLGLKDMHGMDITVPELSINPALIDHFS